MLAGMILAIHFIGYLMLSQESESGNVMESGFYMSSFAVTILIATLLIVGVLFFTLLVTLTAMLGSCQSKSGGLIQLEQANEGYQYCKYFALHAELNSLEADEFPTICKAHAMRYIEEGRYYHELNLTVKMVENYFSTLKPSNDGLDAVLMDIDDIFSSNVTHHNNMLQYGYNLNSRGKRASLVKSLMHEHLLRLHMKLQTTGWPLFFFTRKPEVERNYITQSLMSAGYRSWSFLIMRSDDELVVESWEYLSQRRVELHDKGYRIVSVISTHIDALTGPCLGKRNFKLASPIYYRIEQQINDM